MKVKETKARLYELDLPVSGRLRHDESRSGIELRQFAHRASNGVGHPVNPITGIKFLTGEEDLDFSLFGPITLHWQRSYFSNLASDGWLGQGWQLPFSMCLKRMGDAVTLTDSQCHDIPLPQLAPGETKSLPDIGFHVRREGNGCYHLISADHSTFHRFAPLALDAENPQGEHGDFLPLVSVGDQFGAHIRFLYGDDGLPTRIVDAVGRVLPLQYVTRRLPDGREVSRLRQITLCSDSSLVADNGHSGKVLVTYDYSPEGELIRVRNGEGQAVREYRYRNYVLIEHSQPGALVSRYEYDQCSPQGKVLRIETNTGESWHFRYLPGKTEVVNALGETAHYLFDESNALVGYVDPAGNFSKTDYDAAGNPVCHIDAAGRTHLSTYDVWGNITSTTDPAGARIEVLYHPKWRRPTLVVDPAGAATRFEYDATGNLIRRTDALGHIVEYGWDDRGHVSRITDAHGRVQTFEYDARGQMTSHTDCSRRTTQYGWDDFGHLQSVTNAAGETTHYQCDQRGRVTAVQRADGNKELFIRDLHGRLIAHTDANGARTRWELTADGLPALQTDAQGHCVHYEYDAARRMCRMTNQNGAQCSFSYDAAGRLVSKRGFDGRVTSYRYDASGLLTERLEPVTQARSTVAPRDDEGSKTLRTMYQRDQAGRVIAIVTTRADGARTERSTWRYDAAGRLIEACNDCCRLERKYDALGRLISETTHVAGRTLSLAYDHDALGNHVQTTLPDGRILNYLYYGPGHLHQINLDGELITDIERDALHREASRTQGRLVSHYRYDAVNRLVAQHAVTTQADDAYRVVSREYEFDAANNLLRLTDMRGGTREYRYDALGRLARTGRERFTFDPAGNMLDGPAAPPVCNDRVARFEEIRYVYDSHGNVTEKSAGRSRCMHFDYSPSHRMERARVSGITGEQHFEYGYDALGRRVWKKDDSGTTFFMWEANRLLGETRDDFTVVYVYAHNSFEPLAQIESRANGAKHATILYYHTDQIGMPIELTDSEGRVQWQAAYNAWGSTRIQEMRRNVHQPLRFQGQYFDAETGLHYNQHRYYDPDIGRFTTQDPLGMTGGINLYRYAPNPNAWIDPLGLQGVDLNCFPPGIDRATAGRIPTDPNVFSVAGHGNCQGMMAPNGQMLSAADLAQRIQQHPRYQPGMTVQLLACETGRGQNCFAQQLANSLNTNVVGTNGTIWASLRSSTLAVTGCWINFRPRI
ncbi:RHS repeat-associated core domain-containing protein [Caballeronia ptereochthonis]|uniref:Rhs family protein n=1 Tax=Caballeronia ptereochthonis TaxID=1777144 RepID=A0A158DZ80_9BURK|nr:RHS repeat-associated core domain-containing protein [Caballeronia ptereochthonis]SAK99951.1 Rhs family protein [Caballeronia ptereochthonis]